MSQSKTFAGSLRIKPGSVVSVDCPMNGYVFDSGPLITSCKFSVAGRLIVDHILDLCEVTVAASVGDEVTIAGSRYSDARAAQQRIQNTQIVVVAPPTVPDLERLIAPYALGNGERDSILLTRRPDLLKATVALDDHLAYLVADRLGVRKRFLLDVIADLVRTGGLDRRLAENIVLTIRTCYPNAFVQHTLLLIRSLKMQTITITLDEPLGQFITHTNRSRNVSPQKTALEWMMLGFRAFLTEQYQRYRRGEMSFGRLAAELGVTTWELSHLLEEQGWPASNLPSKDFTRVSEGDATYNINESPPDQQK